MINERPIADAAILPVNRRLLIPGDGIAVFDVSRCAEDGNRLVLLDLGTLRRLDAALILSRTVPPSVGVGSRLLRPTTTRVAELLHQRGIHSVGPTVRAEPQIQRRSSSTRRVPPSDVARRFARWWDELWNVIYRVAAAACDELPL
jgi:hypothetical protein